MSVYAPPMAVSPTTRRARTRVLALLVAALAVPVTACSSGDGSSGAATTGPAAAGPTTTVAPFTGTEDEFYAVPDPLPAGEPGAVIRVQEIDAPDGQVGYRVMYHSRDRLDHDRAATQVVYAPTATAPKDGWPLLVTAHGTTGIISRCAPSRMGIVPDDYGVEGIRVMTDYLGLGPDGELHPYLSKTSEGNALLDGLLATRNLLGAAAGTRWVLVGHSQGGHAALVSSELAAERTPDLTLLGTVAIAPGAQFEHVYGDDIQLRIITALVLMGSESEWPTMKPEDYLSPAVLPEVRKIILNNCLDTIVPAMVPLAARSDFYVQDPRTVGAAKEFLSTNDPTAQDVGSPLLLITGGKDFIVVPARVDALRDRLCKNGQPTWYSIYPAADHGGEPAAASAEVNAWVQARLAGEPAKDNCGQPAEQHPT